MGPIAMHNIDHRFNGGCFCSERGFISRARRSLDKMQPVKTRNVTARATTVIHSSGARMTLVSEDM